MARPLSSADDQQLAIIKPIVQIVFSTNGISTNGIMYGLLNLNLAKFYAKTHYFI